MDEFIATRGKATADRLPDSDKKKPYTLGEAKAQRVVSHLSGSGVASFFGWQWKVVLWVSQWPPSPWTEGLRPCLWPTPGMSGAAAPKLLARLPPSQDWHDLAQHWQGITSFPLQTYVLQREFHCRRRQETRSKRSYSSKSRGKDARQLVAPVEWQSVQVCVTTSHPNCHIVRVSILRSWNRSV